MTDDNEQNMTPSEERRDALRERFSPLLDGELPADERDALERELAGDAELLRELEALKRVDALYRDLPRCEAPEDMADRVRRMVQPEPVRFRRRLVQRTLWPVLAAAATFIVFAAVLAQSGWVGRERPMFMAKSEPALEETGQRALRQRAPAPEQVSRGRALSGITQDLPVDDAENVGGQLGRFGTVTGRGKGAAPESNAALSPEQDAAPETRDQLHEAANRALIVQDEVAPRPVEEEMGASQNGEAQEPFGEPVDESANGVHFKGGQAPEVMADAVEGAETEVQAEKQEGWYADTMPEEAAPSAADSGRVPETSGLGGGTELRRGTKPETPAEPPAPDVIANAITSEPAGAQPSPPAPPPPPPAPPAVRAPERVTGKGDLSAMRIASEEEETDTDADRETRQTRQVGERVFHLHEGVWCQEGYEGQDTTALQRGSDALRAVLEEEESLSGLLELPGWVVFRLDGTWYQVVPAKAPEPGED